MAVTVGFEPTVGVNLHNISSVAPSAARTRHRGIVYDTNAPRANRLSAGPILSRHTVKLGIVPTTKKTPAKQAPRVTIVTRTKDRAILLQRALDDVLDQTFTDWRLIIVNDGGASAPVDALLEERKDRFSGRAEAIHVSGGTGSMEAAANLGAQKADGDFVVVHDDDDTWDPQFLELMVRALDEAPEAVAATARTEVIIEKLDGNTVNELSRGPWVPPGEQITLYDLLPTNRFVPISLLVRRKVYDEIGWYDPALLAVGDWEFHLRLVQHGKVLYVGERPLAFWHQRPHANGSHSNSLFAGGKDHLQFDRLVRDRELQAYVDKNGIGGLLYLSKYIEETVRYYSFQETVRRAMSRSKQALLRPFRRKS